MLYTSIGGITTNIHKRGAVHRSITGGEGTCSCYYIHVHRPELKQSTSKESNRAEHE